MADITFYPADDDVEDFRQKKDRAKSRDFLTQFDGDAKKELQRAIVCSCFAGKHWAVTARTMGRSTETMPAPPKPIKAPESRPDNSAAPPLEYWPMDGAPRDAERAKQRARNTEHVAKIWETADSEVPRHGLIVVAGATGSRKTTYARELARQYIVRLLRETKTRPHILTYEDPIESWFAEDPQQATAAGFEYTPRQRPEDVQCLEDAVSDALRQKPALMYVNEVRDPKEWKALLSFAGTGHLAITTTHAGSLVEAFDRILRAEKAETAAARGRIAGLIVAVVHLRAFGDDVVPSLWVQTGPARMAFMRDGLGSLLPSKYGPTFGRAPFAEKLTFDRDLSADALQSDLSGE